MQLVRIVNIVKSICDRLLLAIALSLINFSYQQYNLSQGFKSNFTIITLGLIILMKNLNSRPTQTLVTLSGLIGSLTSLGLEKKGQQEAVCLKLGGPTWKMINHNKY